MNKLVAFLIVVLLVVGAVFGIQMMLGPEDTGDPGPLAGPRENQPPDREKPATFETGSTGTESEPSTGEPMRSGVARREERGKSNDDKPQGVSGIVVSSRGGTIQGATVYLLRDVAPQDMIRRLMMLSGKRRLPASVESEGRTDVAGRYQLGAEPTHGAAGYELHVVAPGHVIHREKLRLSPDERKQLPTITLTKGTHLKGTILDEATKQPIPEATVRLELPIANGLLVPTPGTEDGIEVKTDRFGRYGLDGLPQEQPLGLQAFARGYGTVMRPELVLAKDILTHVENLELPKGYEIEGWVTDAQGKPIPGARVEAMPYSEQHPTSGRAYCDEDGHFSILGLSEGQYTVSAEAAGYVKMDRKAIPHGTTDLQLVLETQGSVLVRVVRRSQKPVQNYDLELKTYFEGQEHYGRSGIDPVQVRAARDGRYTFSGIDPGSYVFEVTALRLAKTYSQNFVVSPGQAEPIPVEIIMNEGGSLSGRVLDSSGRGVSGVAVYTLDNTYQDNPVTAMFAPLIPVKITKTSTVTDEQGRFFMKLLSPGAYQLKFDHQSYTRLYKKDYEVVEGRTLDIGSVVLSQGGRLEGMVYYRGVPVSQAEVTVSSSGSANFGQVYEKVYTTKEGKFRVVRPLPPGDYDVQASRTNVGNPLLRLVDLQKSKQTVKVIAGQTRNALIRIPN